MIKTKLYAHQQEAIDKLSKVKVGALFMDMGTGKTLTALKLFDIRRQKGKVDRLIFLCPISSKKNLMDEVAKHTDYVYGKDYLIYGIDSISQSDRIYLELLQTVNNRDMLVLDESTYIKNPHAIRTKRALAISEQTQYKLIMTGTPITKFVKDLWGQITFLSPLIFNYQSYYQFAANHLIFDKERGYIVSDANVDYLTQKLSPYVYEKGIEEIKDMPDQVFLSTVYQMSKKRQALYDYTLNKILGEIFLQDASDTIIYQLFTELQKVVSYDPERIEILEYVLDKLNPEQQAIIWFKYKMERNLIIDFLRKRGSTYSIFDGEHKQEEEFKSKKTQFLVANIQTGSHAQNFQNCHYAIFYSNSFDYATRLQAERRIWRTGQPHKCIYYDIISNAGIEDLIISSLSKKEDLLRNFQKLSRRFNKEYLEKYLRKELSVKDDQDRSQPSRETESHQGIPDEPRYSTG